jgi:hypothetical protein
MADLSNIARYRAVVGGVIGLVVFAVDAAATLIRFVLNPFVAERATQASFLAMLLFLFLFVATGALAGFMWGIRVQILRFVFVGALLGTLVWSYLTLTWPLTARASAVAAQPASLLDAMLIGAAGGALGGTLLFVMGRVRRLILGDRQCKGKGPNSDN